MNQRHKLARHPRFTRQHATLQQTYYYLHMTADVISAVGDCKNSAKAWLVCASKLAL